MEKKMEVTIMGFIGTTMKILHSKLTKGKERETGRRGVGFGVSSLRFRFYRFRA